VRGDHQNCCRRIDDLIVHQRVRGDGVRTGARTLRDTEGERYALLRFGRQGERQGAEHFRVALAAGTGGKWPGQDKLHRNDLRRSGAGHKRTSHVDAAPKRNS